MVTIIILLILAGVTVSLVVGQNGLLQKAQMASNTMANATANEVKAMSEMEVQIEELTKKNYAPGLYDENTMEMKKSWEELIQEDVIREADGIVSPGENDDRVNVLDGQIVFPSNLVEFGARTFANCNNLKGNIIIPYSVITIGYQEFYGCNGLTGNLIIGNSVISIQDGAFYRCTGLKGNLIMPNSVTTIGVGAFCECSNLSGDLIIGDSVTSIGASAFSGCSNLSGDLIIPSSVTTLESGAFASCGSSSENGLKSIIINMENIPFAAFASGNNIKSKSLILGSNVKIIGNNAFAECKNITGNLIIPNNVTTIGTAAFYNCTGITGDLVIPNNVSTIGAGAFNNCAGLNRITIADSVSSIGNDAFTNVAHIYYNGTAEGSPWGALAIN